jgi:plasmid stabilization system protein ParE
VARELEYLEEALEEAEAAARWYAERSVAAAAAFSEEIDAAESAIARLPDPWPPYDHERADICSGAFHSAWSIGRNLTAS